METSGRLHRLALKSVPNAIPDMNPGRIYVLPCDSSCSTPSPRTLAAFTGARVRLQNNEAAEERAARTRATEFEIKFTSECYPVRHGVIA